MFSASNVIAFFVRLLVFLLIFSSYPLLHHFSRRIVLLIFKMKEEETTYAQIALINLVLGGIPLIIALSYPKAADVLGIIGSASGFLAIYTIPCVVELKRYKTFIE